MLDISEEFLRRRLEKEHATVRQVAEESGCCNHTIYKKIKKYGITLDRKNKSYNDEDFLAKRFGILTVIESGPNDKHGKSRWLCRCDCGHQKLVNSASLKRGLSKSCGYCVASCPHFKGYGDVSGSWLRRIKESAVQRELSFDVTAEQIYELWIKQNRKCILSGVDIFFTRNQDKSTQTASLDRIDNSIGYTIENVQIIHKRLNRIKSVLSNEELIFWAHLIAKHNPNYTKFETEDIKWTDGQRNLPGNVS